MKDRSTAKDTKEKMDEELKATLTENQVEDFIANRAKQAERPKRGPRQ